jgi:hypothetical protein
MNTSPHAGASTNPGPTAGPTHAPLIGTSYKPRGLADVGIGRAPCFPPARISRSSDRSFALAMQHVQHVVLLLRTDISLGG